MSHPAPPPPAPGQLFVVAIEYAGEDVAIGVGGSRRPVLEHAYEVHSGVMPAHLRLPPRVAFPDPGRGWPTCSHLPRCATCTIALTELVRDVITELVVANRVRMKAWFADPLAELVWLYPAVIA